MMNYVYRWMRQQLGLVLLSCVGIISPAVAFAADSTYTILLKVGGAQATPPGCATGQFAFDKAGKTAGVGYPATSAQVIVTSPCNVGLDAATYSVGTLTVYVNNVTSGSPPQDQGLNVVAVSGTLTRLNPPNGSGQFHRIEFSGNATAQSSITGATVARTNNNNGNGGTTPGTYHAFNVNSVPEPGMLWLVIGALGALVLVRRTRGKVSN